MTDQSFHQLLEPHAKLRTRLVQTNAPSDRAKADKLAKLATDENVAVLADAVARARRDDFYASNDALRNALAVLIHAAAGGDDEAGAVVVRAAERLRDEQPTRSQGRSAYWELFGLFSDVPAAQQACEVLDAVYRELGPTPSALWAAAIGLEVPTDRRWALRIVIPTVEAPSVDLDVRVAWTPDAEAEGHRARLCQDWFSAGDETMIYDWEPAAGPLAYELTVIEEGQTRTLSGVIDPAPADIRDLRRIIDAIETQNAVTFDRAKAKVMGAGKIKAAKAVRGWLTAGVTAAAPTSRPAAKPKTAAKPTSATGATINERLSDRRLAARLPAANEPETRKAVERLAKYAADPAIVANLAAALDGDLRGEFGPRDATGSWVLALLALAAAEETEGWESALAAMQRVAEAVAAQGAGEHVWRAWQPLALFADVPGVAEAAAPLAELVANTPSPLQDLAAELGLTTPETFWQAEVAWIGDGVRVTRGMDRQPGGPDGCAWSISTDGGGGFRMLSASAPTEVEIGDHAGTLPPAPTTLDQAGAYLAEISQIMGVSLTEEVDLEVSKGVKPAAKLKKWAAGLVR